MNLISCTKCGPVEGPKPLSAFPKNKTKKNGHDTECLRCKQTRESQLATRRAKREAFLQRTYGISSKEYDALARKQKSVCAICSQPETRTNTFGELKPLAVDHDHKTKKVRGLLCQKCNKGLGLLGDSRARLMSAFNYLQKARIQ